jgi:hypothetical protein
LSNLADHANRYGIAWPSVDTIGEEESLSRRAVQQALRTLEARGEIVRVSGAKGGRNKTTRYEVLPGKGAPDAPRAPRQTAQSTSERAQSDPQRAHFEREKGDEAAPEQSSVTARERSLQHPHVGEGELATGIIEHFNLTAGANYSVAAYGGMVAARVREHPELTLEDHRRVIGLNLGAPWWDGPPSPRVIYRDAAAFESALHCDGTPRVELSETDKVSASIRELKRIADGGDDEFVEGSAEEVGRPLALTG